MMWERTPEEQAQIERLEEDSRAAAHAADEAERARLAELTLLQAVAAGLAMLLREKAAQEFLVNLNYPATTYRTFSPQQREVLLAERLERGEP